MATEETLIVHPGDIIQATQQGPIHGHLFLVSETHRWGVGAVMRWTDDGEDRETYHRFTDPAAFVVVGTAHLLPPDVAARRRDSVATQRTVEREKAK